MLIKLIVLFTILPFVELAILLKLNTYIGFGYTLSIVFLTGILGAYMSRLQGKQVISRIKTEIKNGRMPGEELINGLCILVGGIMLITPGILTDVFGFFLVLPVTRQIMKSYLKRRLKKMIQEGRIDIYFRW